MKEIDKIMQLHSEGLPEVSNHKIRPVDLKAGMFVIVSEWNDEKNGPSTETKESFMGHYEVPIKKKPVGDPMKVLAIALPYITVDVIQHKQRGVIDTRLMELMKVDKKYVRSLVPDYGKKIKPPKRLTEAEKIASEYNTRKVLVAGSSVWKEIMEKRK